MIKDSFKKKLIQGENLLGTILTVSSPDIAEILAHCGFDWFFIDLEHSSLNVDQAKTILQTVSSDVSCVVRVPSNDEVWIKTILDIGVSGIIIPQVNSSSQASKAVNFCKYPPSGIRSVGISRAHGYGASFNEYINSANDEVAVIIQIEHIDAVNNIDEILEVEGIDSIFIGPYDLSASMGKIGKITDSEVQKAILKVKEAAIKKNVPVGIFCQTSQQAKDFSKSGYSLIAVSIDTLMIRKAAVDIVNSFKE